MAVETYNVTLPRTIYSGKNALSNLKTVVAGAKKVAIFTDKGILSTGLVELPLIQLKEAGVESVVISICLLSQPTLRSRSWWTNSRPPVRTLSWLWAAAAPWTRPSWRASWLPKSYTVRICWITRALR